MARLRVPVGRSNVPAVIGELLGMVIAAGLLAIVVRALPS